MANQFYCRHCKKRWVIDGETKDWFYGMQLNERPPSLYCPTCYVEVACNE